MKKKTYPDRKEALELLKEAGERNPGPWTEHSLTAAHCAEKIAGYAGMDAEKAYILGLLHDIGRRFGKRHLGHVSDGYSYMMSLGYEDCARICLTHSFNGKDLDAYVGNFDTTEEETQLLREKLSEAVFDDYDRLIQLCDSIAGPGYVMDIIDRMTDVKNRYGSYDPAKWDANLALKEAFEKRMGRDLYEAVEKDTFQAVSISQVDLEMDDPSENRPGSTEDLLELRRVSPEYRDEILAYCAEFPKDRMRVTLEEDRIPGLDHLEEYDDMTDWFRFTEEMAGKISWFLTFRTSDQRLVGCAIFRHDLKYDDDDPEFSSHIGYSVRPSEQRKGYAKEQLRLLLRKAKEAGLLSVRLICRKENTGSKKTILANGGVYVDTIHGEESGMDVERFDIRL